MAEGGREPILVSACLLGLRTRYDGASRPSAAAQAALAGAVAVPVCPEQLGGLPTPRAPADFRNGVGPDVLDGRAGVVNANAQDVTAQFVAGAQAALDIARLAGARRAFLKERSASCGVGEVYCGGRLVVGMGVCAALLRREGIEVVGFR
jgi:uncharacterized protein YbbK (DUF523 family)